MGWKVKRRDTDDPAANLAQYRRSADRVIAEIGTWTALLARHETFFCGEHAAWLTAEQRARHRLADREPTRTHPLYHLAARVLNTHGQDRLCWVSQKRAAKRALSRVSGKARARGGTQDALLSTPGVDTPI